MATIKALRSGNWSDVNLATSPWSNGSVITAPGNGDTVYANGFDVTIDVDITIGGANNPIVNAGSFVPGQWYQIVEPGNATFPGAGSNSVGVEFLATGVGTGTGTAKARATITTAANTSAGAAANGQFLMSTIVQFSADVRYGTTTVLTITAPTGTLVLSDIIMNTITASRCVDNNGGANVMFGNCIFRGGSSPSSGTAFTMGATRGSITIFAPCQFEGSAYGGHGLLNNSRDPVNIHASCTFIGGGWAQSSGFRNEGVAPVNIHASCTFIGGNSTTSSGQNNAGFYNNSTGIVNIYQPCIFIGGNSTGTSQSNHGFINASSSSVAFIAAGSYFSGGTSGNLGFSTAGDVKIGDSTFVSTTDSGAIGLAANKRSIISGSMLTSIGLSPIQGGTAFIYDVPPSLAFIKYSKDGTILNDDSYQYQFTSNSFTTFSSPPVSSVRVGVLYSGISVGTCNMPQPSAVAYGTVYDSNNSKFGLAINRDNVIFNTLLNNLSVINSVGDRVKKSSTTEATGHLIASFSN